MTEPYETSPYAIETCIPHRRPDDTWLIYKFPGDSSLYYGTEGGGGYVCDLAEMYNVFDKYLIEQFCDLAEKFWGTRDLFFTLTDEAFHGKPTLETYEECLAAVTENGWTLQWVPGDLMTPEICLAAVTQNGLAFEYVPEELVTLEICLAAVSQGGKLLRWVPEAFKTLEICLAAVTQNGDALWCVPEALKTPEICRAAITQDPEALEYSPYSILELVCLPEEEAP